MKGARSTLFLATLAVGCAPEDPGDESMMEPTCRRFEEKIDGACSPVEVVDVDERAFSFDRDGWTLDGTLLVPTTAGEYLPPAAVIVHGSGPVGRDGRFDGSLGIAYSEPVVMYRSLAEQLAQSGFAVLIYDKRSCFSENSDDCDRSITEYSGDIDALVVHDFLEDARAATQAVVEEPDVGDEVLLLGHSQGASFVPQLAREEDPIFAGAMLAGPVLSLADTVGGQYDDLADYVESLDPNDPQIPALRDLADEARMVLTEIEAGTYPEPTWNETPVLFWESWIELQGGVEIALEACDKPLAAYYAGFDFNVGPAHHDAITQWVEDGAVDADVQFFDELTHVFVTLNLPGNTTEFDPEASDSLIAWVQALDQGS